jgi:hypothetical protein
LLTKKKKREEKHRPAWAMSLIYHLLVEGLVAHKQSNRPHTTLYGKRALRRLRLAEPIAVPIAFSPLPQRVCASPQSTTHITGYG